MRNCKMCGTETHGDDFPYCDEHTHFCDGCDGMVGGDCALHEMPSGDYLCAECFQGSGSV